MSDYENEKTFASMYLNDVYPLPEVDKPIKTAPQTFEEWWNAYRPPLSDAQIGWKAVAQGAWNAAKASSPSMDEQGIRIRAFEGALKAIESWHRKDHDEILYRNAKKGKYVGFPAGIDAAEGAIANLILREKGELPRKASSPAAKKEHKPLEWGTNCPQAPDRGPHECAGNDGACVHSGKQGHVCLRCGCFCLCQWCNEGNPRICSSVSERLVHTDTSVGRVMCLDPPSSPAVAGGESETAKRAWNIWNMTGPDSTQWEDLDESDRSRWINALSVIKDVRGKE